MKIRFAFIFLFAVWLGICPATALDPAKPISYYKHDVWQTNDDLPHPTVQSILQSRDGYIWLGTHGGLVRFDGVRFVTYDNRTFKAIRDNRISSLVEGRDGTLWIGTDGGGLAGVKNGQWVSYTTREGLAHDRIKVLLEGKDGALWIGTYGGGLSRMSDGKFSNFTVKDGLADRHILALCEDGQGTLWVGTRGGLSRMAEGRFSTYPIGTALPQMAIQSMCLDLGGDLWVGTSGKGLARFHEGKFLSSPPDDPLATASIQSLYQDREGSLWIGTLGNGLARLTRGKVSSYGVRDGLSDDNVLALAGDREGNLWIGTEDGLNKLSSSLFVTYTTGPGLPQDQSRTICEGADGSIWVGSRTGRLNRLQQERWTGYSARDGLLETEIGPLFPDADGGLWIGSYGGLVHFKGGKFINLTPLLSYPHVSAIGRDRNGLLVATGMRLSRFKGDRLVSSFEVPVNLKYIFAIHGDRNSNLWLATSAGLALLKDGNCRVFTTSDGLAGDVVHSIYEDRAGDLWLATSGGLSRFHNEKFSTYTTQDGLFDNVILQILEDDNDNLWMSCSRGIFRVSKSDLEARSAGKLETMRVVSYNTGDGLKSVECAGPTQPAGWKSRDGKLWFPTTKGPAVIDPRHPAGNTLAPPVVIESAVVDGNAVTLLAGTDIPPGKGNLEFQYSALSFVDPRKVQFKRMLAGYDREWVDAGSRRRADYTNIPPGEYVFKVMAANNDGIWNEQGASFRFYLRPHFYQTYWFYALCLALVVAAAWQFYVLRMKRMREEFAAVTEERNRIAREVHDTLAQGFAGISVQLEASKQMLLEAPHEAEKHLDQANLLARSCLGEVRQFVWNLRHQAIAKEDLASKLSDLAKRIAAGASFRFKTSGVPRGLPAPIENNLLRIGQEAIVNAAKHAQADHIEVELMYEAGKVGLQVRDNGSGFVLDERQPARDGGFGLLGMKERANQIGGQLTIRTSPGRGTEIRVDVPLDAQDH